VLKLSYRARLEIARDFIAQWRKVLRAQADASSDHKSQKSTGLLRSQG